MSESTYIRGFWDAELDAFNYTLGNKEEICDQSEQVHTIIILPLPSILTEETITDEMDSIILSNIVKADLDCPVYLYSLNNADCEELNVDILITDFTVELLSALEGKDELINFQRVLNDAIAEGFDSMLEYTEYVAEDDSVDSEDETFIESAWEYAFEEDIVKVMIIESEETFLGLKVNKELHSKVDASGQLIPFNDEEMISEIRKSIPEAMVIKQFTLPATKTDEELKEFMQSEINKLKAIMGAVPQTKIIH